MCSLLTKIKQKKQNYWQNKKQVNNFMKNFSYIIKFFDIIKVSSKK